MGCCSLKEKDREFSGVSRFFRLNFFRLLHSAFLLVVLVRSLFNKRYAVIHDFYRKFYAKAEKELR